MNEIILKNAEIYLEEKVMYGYDLYLSNGKIKQIGESIIDKNVNEIDLNGKKIVPGFIDIHIHGGVGCDVMDANYDSINKISMHLARHGITSFCPTTMTMELNAIINALKNIKQSMEIGTDGAKIIGAYVEGPFISIEHKGAQDEKYILKPSIDIIDKLLKASNHNIKVVTIAPENDLDGDFIKFLIQNNIKVSLGHTNATFNEMENAITNGASIAVHTFNGMRGFHHREPGALGAVFIDNRIYSELICDFIHSHSKSVKLLLKLKGTKSIILISDAMVACGLGDGNYELGGQKVIVSNNVARIESGSLAGSTLTLDKAISNIVSLGVPLSDAVKMASLNPAKAIGIDNKKGSIDIGKDADLVVLNNDLSVYMTIIAGKVVYKEK